MKIINAIAEHAFETHYPSVASACATIVLYMTCEGIVGNASNAYEATNAISHHLRARRQAGADTFARIMRISDACSLIRTAIVHGLGDDSTARPSEGSSTRMTYFPHRPA